MIACRLTAIALHDSRKAAGAGLACGRHRMGGRG
jgi:hypothetical protein